MKKSTLFLIILLAIFFTSTLILLFFNFNKKLAPLQNTNITPIPTQTETPPIDPTANWKTYSNTKYNFSFQYPSDYKIYNSNLPENYIALFQGKNYKIETNDFGSKNTGDYYYLIYKNNCQPDDIWGDKKIISSEKNITIYKITGYEGPDHKSAIIKNNNQCFEMTCSSEEKCDGQLFEEFTQILSTFKIIDSNENSGTISASELTQGWYWGDKNQKKLNTPDNWVFTDNGRSSCWHAPEQKCTFSLPD